MATAKTIFILLCLLWISPALQAQYTIRQWNVEDGLPQSSVKCIAQTHDGYLWIGTWNGLARFDGVHMTVFNALNTPGLNPSIDCIHEDRNHQLWVGTDGGGLYQFRDDSLVRVNDPSFQDASIIDAMNEDSQGRMWFGTDTGIFVYARNHFIRFHYTNPLPFLPLTEILPVPDGSLYLQFVYEVYHVRLSGDSLSILDKPFHTGGYRIDRDSTGNLWYGVKGTGLIERSGSRERVDRRFSDIDPEQVFVTHNQDTWVVTPHGPYVLSGARMAHLQSIGGIDLSNIENVFEDREGILWLAVSGSGLLRLMPQQVETFGTGDGLGTGEVMCGMQDHSGTLWVGTWLGGLARRSLGSRGSFSRVSPFEIGITVMSVCQSRDRTIWVGTWGHGVYTIHDGVTTRFRANGLGDNTSIREIVRDTANGVWIAGVYGAVWHCNGVDVKLWNSRNGLTDRPANSILVTRNGDVWVGTDGGGIARFSKDRISLLNDKNGLIDNFAHVAIEDNSGAVWITSKIGLQRWKNGVLSGVTAQQGFDDDPAQFIQDNDGDYWIGGTHGIHRIRSNDLNDAADGKLATLDYLTIGKSEGMPVEECSGGSNQHVWKTRDGNLWFSTTHGAVRIDPRTVATNQVPPGVMIEQVQIEHQQVPLPDAIVMRPGQTRIEFDYTGINFSAPEQIRFAYRLQGFDKDWREVGTERYAQYTNLAPGTYAFHVRAANNAGVWNETGTSINITVLPPFWATWWFRGVAVLLFLTVGPAIYAFRVRQLKGEHERQAQFSRRLMQTQEAERQRIANELHDSLGQNLLVIKNKLLMAAQDRGDGNGLGEMSDLVSTTIEEVRSISHNLRPHQLDQLGISKTIRALAKQVSETSGVALTADVDNIDGLLNSDEEINLFRILQECCNNMIKHSRATAAGLSVKRSSQQLEVAIGDNGRGIGAGSAQSQEGFGRGFGLSGMHDRARTFGWRLEIQSLRGSGTTVQLIVPLNGKKGNP